jgi:ABC-type multidrug transport system ATPase subunit
MATPSEGSFNEDISVKCFIEYVCSEQKIDRINLLKYLKHIGIRDEEFKKKLSGLTFETQKKITCAIGFALDKETLVIDDFIKGSSRNFENKFLELLDFYLSQGNKKVVYVSVDIFLPAVTNRLYEVDQRGYKPFILSPKRVSLR